MMSHESPHPAREGLGRGRPNLQAKAAQHAPQAHLDIMALGLQKLAGGQKRANLLGRERLAVHRPEPAQAHQLGNAAGVLAISLHRHGLEGSAHVTRLEQFHGKPGRAIIGALIAGECDPDALLRLVQRGVKDPPERLRGALTGRVTERHRFLLRLHLRQIDALEVAIAEIDQEVDRDLDPFRQAVRLLRTIPGVSDLTAQVIVSEIGIDMNRFPTAGHLVSWAGLCPRNDESAGKRRSTRLRKGAPWLKTTLVQCAWAGTRKKGSDLQAQFQRLRHRRGPKKAVCAVAASILTAAYHMLRDGSFYQDLGPDHLRRATPETQASRLARQITRLGFTCTLAPANKLVSV